MKEIRKFVSEDGESFTNREDCENYEATRKMASETGVKVSGEDYKKLFDYFYRELITKRHTNRYDADQ